MTVLLLDRLAGDVQRLGDQSPGPTLLERLHDVFCLEVVSENAKRSDGTEAVVGAKAVDDGSSHGATLVADCPGRNLSCDLRSGTVNGVPALHRSGWGCPVSRPASGDPLEGQWGRGGW